MEAFSLLRSSTLFASLVVCFIAAPKRANGDGGNFTIRDIDAGATISNAGRYGALEANGSGRQGVHFVPAPQRDGVPAGRYAVVAGAVASADATTYVPAAPFVVPARRVGQHFLRVTTQLGSVQPTADFVTLAAIDTDRHPARLTFAGAKPLIVDSDADVAHLVEVRPLLSDANVVRAQSAFSGRDAWTLGPVDLTCVTAPNKTVLLAGGTRVRIEGIARVQNLPSFHAIGQQNAWYRDSPSSFWTTDPLVVIVRIPHGADIVGASISVPAVEPEPWDAPGTGAMLPVGTRVGNAGIVGPPGATPLPNGKDSAPPATSLVEGCEIGTNDLSDPWELQRTFSVHSPASFVDWSRSTHQALSEQRIIVGMPRAAVAFVDGYPGTYGSADRLNHFATWSYDSPPPFSFSIGFDRNGRVESYQPPGNLP